jgi:pimeloyl-ACP methyl ester carboxylesterase/ubiquinone/menaquinone biosynthesis C-methylase UbiE
MLAYEEHGTGDETVVLSHSYLVDRRQFDAQIEVLRERYRVLAYDHRGHGESDKPEDGYDIESLYRDAEGFIEATNAAPCHFVGLSTGGFVGLRLGFRRPDLLRSLVLMDTSAESEPLLKRAKYEAMFAVAKRAGLGPVIDKTMAIMFGPEFLSDPERRDEVALWRERILAGDVTALVRFGRGIFARDSVVDHLGEISVPTLVMVGEHDEPQPLGRAQVIAGGIPGAGLFVIPRAGHLSTIDNPGDVTSALSTFIETGRLTGPDDGGDARVGQRSPRSVLYDGALYGRVIEPLLGGVHAYVVANLPDGDRVLDACCGTGGLARRMAAAGHEVVGVDLSPRNINFATRNSTSSSLSFEIGDVAHLDHDDQAFDVATVVMALHEMPEASRVPVLRELGRVARRVLVVDFAVPMPRNVSGLRNRAVELAAGRNHVRAFRNYSERGGLQPIAEAAGLQVSSERLLNRRTLAVQLLHR